MDTEGARRQGLGGLTLGALGVVYGDIGTSPLYTTKEIFSPGTGVPLDAWHLIGATSTVFWALMLVVTLKYVVLILRADNHGEGGIMALTALAVHAAGSTARRRAVMLSIGVLGAALFYGDSVITPAISVLGAVEGLEVMAPGLKPWIVPIAVAILVALFIVQRHGTRRVGNAFGPIVLVWFAVLAITGAWQISQQPAVLEALDPRRAYAFLVERGPGLFLAVGAIVLAITGAEALYADMGHFGRRPIRLAWSAIVLPSLALNYAGQAALLMGDPGALENPFFRLFPSAWLVPALILATLAAVIASQAVISGAYSMTRQAIQLGLLPRMTIRHTSASAIGQVYMPAVNWLLLGAVAATVIGFGNSSRLASAYGVAVMGTMLVTTLLTYFVLRYDWRYPLVVCVLGTGFFAVVDGAFFAAAAHKIVDGGWFPLVLGGIMFGLMWTWRHGREALLARLRDASPPLAGMLESLYRDPPPCVPGTAVFLTSSPGATPNAFLHSLKHYKVVHAQNVFLTIEFDAVPWVASEARVLCEPLNPSCWRIVARYGFMEQPDAALALELCAPHGLSVDPMEVSYFLSREKLVPGTAERGAARWRDRIFVAMARNAGSVTDYFNLPPNRVVELGTRVAL